MKNIKVLGIKRGKTFSPNHIGNDEAIFLLSMEALKERGYVVEIYSEEEFLSEPVSPVYVLIVSMAREKAVIKKLQQLEQQGIKIINSGFGVENCFRTNMTNLLLNNHIPYPESFIVPTSCEKNHFSNNFQKPGVWIKRGDFHAIHKEDVTFAASEEEGIEILREYALRGIPDAVISKHLVGDLVKFYGVRNTDFFFWFYPYEHNHHKYAHYEEINGKLVYNAFDESELERIAFGAAEVLDVFIFGGDAIVDAAGNLHIIDLNDWPSFAPCREEGAKYIAQLLINILEKHTNGVIAGEKQKN
ncbi:ATP-grasp domain-containing protein [Olivibacter domesticus]|uniref:Glutathione synthase/RimK-type ligase, ATP-grasp superfamily n=1 Tax=Olivibacter domesticus TaxID=407022 RepID=A0A1H7QV50_OLID1|nr:hypothetical protein [Olivibacter domesticus]SEL51505.1 hypothetical protein SAMN05661044_02727 [Olivibacter domesticus]